MASERLRLPAELWIHIFQIATHHPLLHSVKYEPFDPCVHVAEEMHAEMLQVKLAITLVCRSWRDMSLHMLYEDVWFRHGDASLGLALKGDPHAAEPGRGRWVRRATLPYSHTETVNPNPPRALLILHHCPALEVLVRPWTGDDRLRFEFPTETVALPRLKRLDWWYHAAAARSGGINSLDQVLQSAPSIEYLSLGGEMWLFSLHAHFELPRVKVLRLRRVNTLFVVQIAKWTMPALTHLLLECPLHPDSMENLWEALGPTLRCVEFGSHIGFTFDDQLSLALRQCPCVEELNYYLFFTMRLARTQTHESLRRVGLHALQNDAIYPSINGAPNFPHIEAHFYAYPTERFPALREFVLYGKEWRAFVEDQQFSDIVKVVEDSGRVIDISQIY
ncbi:hypothetical protein FA95DRAFT_745028 [Auriscalpium vulgare]|uniref:Uncharacterized protein n=1 Tax=Auriscalpium vulgare TaxID=40419 RepID=A0ACB8SC16_9AGAM|nr:hypothetical protein FA95DRAFT_745028 [Auriscalpium vulgare]